MTLRSLRALQLTAAVSEQTTGPGPVGHVSMRGRSIEFARALLIAISLAGAALTMVKVAFGVPLVRAAVALAH